MNVSYPSTSPLARERAPVSAPYTNLRSALRRAQIECFAQSAELREEPEEVRRVEVRTDDGKVIWAAECVPGTIRVLDTAAVMDLQRARSAC